MLDRFANRPPSKPLCFLSRRNEADHIDYDLASYIMQWTPAPEGSQPTIRHLLHRLRQAVNEYRVTYPYTESYRLNRLQAVHVAHHVTKNIDPQLHGQPVRPPVRALLNLHLPEQQTP